MKWVIGKTKLVKRAKTASTVFAKGGLVNMVSGYLLPADATSGDFYGIVQKAVVATDDDYADNTFILVEVPVDKMCEFEAPVDGTLTQALVGTAMDLTDSENVNQAATSKEVVTCTKFISASKGRFILNATADVANVATT